jgi:2-polyprenyl-3-methyl-5-hydroxy-6-metoxy-1,4-benzoquinol methylase
MKIKTVVDRVIEFSQTPQGQLDPQRKALLESFGTRFAQKDCQSITSGDVDSFVHEHFNQVRDSGTYYGPNFWNTQYTAWRQNKAFLPWEAGHATNVVRGLFDDPSFRPRTVLELGCGTGRNAVFMAQKGCSVTAVDLSAEAIDIAQKNAQEAGVSCNFICSDLFKLQLTPASFDFILDKGCFHHVPVIYYGDYERLVSSSLVPGGHFQLICVTPHWSYRLFDAPALRWPLSTLVLSLAPAQLVRAPLLSRALLGAPMSKFLLLLYGSKIAGVSASEIQQVFARSFEIRRIERVHTQNEVRPLVCMMRRKIPS